MRLLTKTNYVRVIFMLSVLIIFIATIRFSWRADNIRQSFQQQITTIIEAVLQQHYLMLQRLSQNLILPIQQQDNTTISAYLAAYEDQLFVAAKQNLAVPASLNLVSFTVPVQILSSAGSTDESVLAPDEEYYLQIVRQPEHLNISQPYVRTEMPAYKLINLGLGVLDQQKNFLAHLDAKLSLLALHNLVQSRLQVNTKLYDFELNAGLQPQIVLHKRVYWFEYLCFTAWCLVLSWIVLLGMWLLISASLKWRKQSSDLSALQEQVKTLTASLAHCRQAYQVQYNYGVLVANNICLQNIELHEFIAEIQSVNTELIERQQINLILPPTNTQRIIFYAHRVRLMQMLSGILQEIILQSSIGTKLELSVELLDINNQRMLKFKFADNGFYARLMQRDAQQSDADIRAQGWQRIFALAALENAEIKHNHTAYVGNVITCAISYQIKNNVVNLEQFCREYDK